LPPSPKSPEDFGLGASRLAVNDDKGEREYVRTQLSRSPGADSSDVTDPRAIVHGPSTTSGADERLVVTGPVKDFLALRRQVVWVVPFDTAGTIRRSWLTVADAVQAGRRSGRGSTTLLRADPTLLVGAVPLLPVDPTAASDLVFEGGQGLVAFPKGTEGTMATVVLGVPRTEDSRIISAVQLGPEETALMESGDVAKVFRVTSAGTTVLFEFRSGGLDTLAVGPQGEVRVLRIPSVSEPASPLDPAYIVLPGGSPVALASWSTLTSAADPACVADGRGWRAIFETPVPWVTLAGGTLEGPEEPMLARVRWSPDRVCLEAIELHAEEFAWPGEGATNSFVVARFAGSAAAVRIGIGPGTEARQALECRLAP
jgi:hypothetical protein